MMFEGSAIRLQQSEFGVAELHFDREDRPVNTLDSSAMEELGRALDALEGEGDDDTLYGGSGDDLLFGGDGNDVIYGDDWA